MNVLLVAHQLPPRHRAGTEVCTARLARALSARGHAVTVFAADDDPCRREGGIRERLDGSVRIVEIAVTRVARRPADSWTSTAVERAFADLMGEVRPAICHFHHLRNLSLALPGIARERGARTLLTLHDYWLLCARDGQLVDADGRICPGPGVLACARCVDGFRFGLTHAEARTRAAVARIRERCGVDVSEAARRIGLLARRIASRVRAGLPRASGPDNLALIEARRAAVAEAVSAVDIFIAPSKFLEGVFAREEGFRAARFVVLGNGVDGPLAPPRRPRDRNRPLRIGFSGVVAPPKGVDVLIAATEKLPEGRYEVDVHGAFDQRPEYARGLIAASRGRPIRFHGAFEPGTAAEFMPSWDVAVAPSRWVENQPLAILEAFAAGVPVVASDLGGMRELVRDGVDGRLVPRDDPGALATVLRGFIEDPELLDRLRGGVMPPSGVADHAAAVEKLYDDVMRTP